MLKHAYSLKKGEKGAEIVPFTLDSMEKRFNYFFGKYPKMPNYLFGKYPRTVLNYHDSEAENAIRHVQICPLYAISQIK
jgi:hypothetical protein